MPSKALLAAAARGTSFAEARAEVHRAVETIAATEDDAALRRDGVRVVHGRAVFRTPTEIDVDGTRFRSERFVVATGAGPTVPPIDSLDRLDYLTNENLFVLDRSRAVWRSSAEGPSGPRWGRPSPASVPGSH